METLEQFYRLARAKKLKLPTQAEITERINVRLGKAIAEGRFPSQFRSNRAEKETITARPKRTDQVTRKLVYCTWVFCNRLEHTGALEALYCCLLILQFHQECDVRRKAGWAEFYLAYYGEDALRKKLVGRARHKLVRDAVGKLVHLAYPNIDLDNERLNSKVWKVA